MSVSPESMDESVAPRHATAISRKCAPDGASAAARSAADSDDRPRRAWWTTPAWFDRTRCSRAATPPLLTICAFSLGGAEARLAKEKAMRMASSTSLDLERRGWVSE